jgi:hypothetical protein
MTKPPTDPVPPADVLQALETLERGTSPTELGPAYKELLRWQNKNLPWRPSRGLVISLLAGLLLTTAVLLLRRLDFELSDFWPGALFGVFAVSTVISMRRWFSRRPAPTPTLRERVEIAIDRWRHAVPAMRDFPK